jgi:deoxyribodipyrimidine photolyase-like uncharacterized protein
MQSKFGLPIRNWGPRTRRILVPASLAFALAACLPTYEVSTAQDTAEFFLSTTNDSQSTTLRSAYVWAFKDEECTRSPLGMRAGQAVNNDSGATTTPLKVVANEKFVFTAGYIDARFAQNRQCSVTAAFVPRKNRRYKAQLVVSDDVRGCRVGVYDVTSNKDQQIEFSMPQYLCDDEGKTARLNGSPLWTDWQVQVNVASGRR